MSVPSQHQDSDARSQAVRFEVLEKALPLVLDPAYDNRLTLIALIQGNQVTLGDLAACRRDRVPMRVHFRISEQVVDPLEQAVGNRVLQGFRFLMNLVPLHPQDFYEKQLDQSVSSQN